MDENMKIELTPQFDYESECKSIELEILKPTNEVDARLDEIEGKIADLDISIDKLTNHADKLDYTVAVASGILTGFVDAIFVGTMDWNIDFDINSQRNETHKDFNKFIEDVAAKCGYTGEQRLKGSIGKLEDTFSVAQDNVWKGRGIGVTAKSHHLDDLAHHPTLLGLISAVAVELFRVGIFQNKNGELFIVNIETSQKERIIKMLPAIISGLLLWTAEMAEKKYYDQMDEKIPKAIRELVKALSIAPLAIQVLRVSNNWVGHLISDVHGSKHSAGEGMGIPGIFISLLKEISMIPGVNLTPLPKIVGELYQTEKIDLRTEVMFVREALDTGKELLPQLKKQALPIVLNEVLVRSFYFVRHLATELKGKNAFSEVDWNKVIPIGNRTIERMMTIATGTFTAIDTLDAVIEGAINSKANWVEFGRQVVLRLNFVGIGRFTIALGTDAFMGLRKGKKSRERMLLKAESLYLLEAKMYYGDQLMWSAVKDAGQSVDSLFEAMQNLSTQITEDMKAAQGSIREIENIDISAIDANNKELTTEILDIL